MPSGDNKVIIACAGSGKTTRLVEDALTSRDRRIAIVTYTNNNVREIVKRFGELNSGVPEHVDVFTWFGFLLQECARPYQRSKYAERRIESLSFVNQQSAQYVPEWNTRDHYFAKGEFIFSDKIAKFIVKCQKLSEQRVMGRLRQFYSDIYVDEFQDLAGWDLEIIELILRSDIRIRLVGDPRQHIYSTNPSQKNKPFLGSGVVKLVRQWEKDGLCKQEPMNKSHRCHQTICDFSNGLWPDLDRMDSLRTDIVDHQGVFLVAETDIHDYVHRFAPRVLRYNKSAKSYGYEALNFGMAKGLEFDRVLVVPNGPIKAYLQSGDLKDLKASKDKLHVAVTRARHSLAFVFDGESRIVSTRYR